MTTLYKTAIDVQNKIALCADDDGVIDVEKLELIETTYNNGAFGGAPTVAIFFTETKK